MTHDPSLDIILASLALPSLSDQANQLLDLRDSAFPPADAGRCIKIYFELHASAPADGALDRPLAALRGWLENSLNIEVIDGTEMMPIERLPLRFQGENDLETFCRSTMHNFINDRCQAPGCIRMQFGFVTSDQ